MYVTTTGRPTNCNTAHVWSGPEQRLGERSEAKADAGVRHDAALSGLTLELSRATKWRRLEWVVRPVSYALNGPDRQDAKNEAISVSLHTSGSNKQPTDVKQGERLPDVGLQGRSSWSRSLVKSVSANRRPGATVGADKVPMLIYENFAGNLTRLSLLKIGRPLVARASSLLNMRRTAG
jgi:hypothetical protein